MTPSIEMSGLASFANKSATASPEAMRVGGVFYPTLASVAGRFTDAATLAPTGEGGSIASALVGGSAGAGSFFREQVPWEPIADWTHSLSKTPTDQWMDVVDGFVRGPNHRWLHHHPVDFANEWLSQGPNGQLQIGDYLRHVGLDAITTKGLPILPEAAQRMLVDAGIPHKLIYDWTHVNCFDVTVGALSVADGSYQMFLSISGHLPWEGMKTIVLSFGIGGGELVAGVLTQNPLLVFGGALRVGAGALSYWEHIHAPIDSMLPHLVHGLLGGIGAGCVVSAFRLALTWGSTTKSEKAAIASESLLLSSTLGTLAVISPWLSIPLGLSYGLGKFAFRTANSNAAFWDKLHVSSPFAEALSRRTIEELGGKEAIEEFNHFTRKRPSLEIDEDLKKCLECMPDWNDLPIHLKDVFRPMPFRPQST